MSNNAVGRAIRSRERYANDEEYREKNKIRRRNYYYKHREKEIARSREWNKKLGIFADKHCKICNKRLDFRTMSGFCIKHQWRNYEKKKQIK